MSEEEKPEEAWSGEPDPAPAVEIDAAKPDPVPAGHCPSCQHDLLPRALFCHFCGARVLADGFGLVRIGVAFVLVNLVIALATFGTCLCFTVWGALLGIPLIVLSIYILRWIGARLK